MSPKRTEKVQQAIEQARRAQGRPIDQGDLDSDWPGASRPQRLELYGHVTAKMRTSAAARFGSLLARARRPGAAGAESASE